MPPPTRPGRSWTAWPSACHTPRRGMPGTGGRSPAAGSCRRWRFLAPLAGPAPVPRRARGEFAGPAGSARVSERARSWPAVRRLAPAGSMRTWLSGRASPCQGEGRGFESRRPLGVPGAVSRADVVSTALRYPGRLPWRESPGGMAEWLRQGPAKPCTRVRFPLPPRGRLAQRESASLTRKRSLVQIQYRPPGQMPDWP